MKLLKSITAFKLGIILLATSATISRADWPPSPILTTSAVTTFQVGGAPSLILRLSALSVGIAFVHCVYDRHLFYIKEITSCIVGAPYSFIRGASESLSNPATESSYGTTDAKISTEEKKLRISYIQEHLSEVAANNDSLNLANFLPIEQSLLKINGAESNLYMALVKLNMNLNMIKNEI